MLRKHNLKVMLGLSALALLLGSALLSPKYLFQPKHLSRSLSLRLKTACRRPQRQREAAEVERKRKIAAGLPPVSASDVRLGQKGIRSVLYHVAVRKTTCFEQAVKQEKDYQNDLADHEGLFRRCTNELLKFSKDQRGTLLWSLARNMRDAK